MLPALLRQGVKEIVFNISFLVKYINILVRYMRKVYGNVPSFILKNNDIAEVNNNHVTTRKNCLSLIIV